MEAKPTGNSVEIVKEMFAKYSDRIQAAVQ